MDVPPTLHGDLSPILPTIDSSLPSNFDSIDNEAELNNFWDLPSLNTEIGEEASDDLLSPQPIARFNESTILSGAAWEDSFEQTLNSNGGDLTPTPISRSYSQPGAHHEQNPESDDAPVFEAASSPDGLAFLGIHLSGPWSNIRVPSEIQDSSTFNQEASDTHIADEKSTPLAGICHSIQGALEHTNGNPNRNEGRGGSSEPQSGSGRCGRKQGNTNRPDPIRSDPYERVPEDFVFSHEAQIMGKGVRGGCNHLALFGNDAEPRTKYPLLNTDGRQQIHSAYEHSDIAIPPRLTLREICGRYPNHVWGDFLRMFLSEGWRGREIYDALPTDCQTSASRDRAHNSMQQACCRVQDKQLVEEGTPFSKGKRPLKEEDDDLGESGGSASAKKRTPKRTRHTRSTTAGLGAADSNKDSYAHGVRSDNDSVADPKGDSPRRKKSLRSRVRVGPGRRVMVPRRLNFQPRRAATLTTAQQDIEGWNATIDYFRRVLPNQIRNMEYWIEENLAMKHNDWNRRPGKQRRSQVFDVRSTRHTEWMQQMEVNLARRFPLDNTSRQNWTAGFNGDLRWLEAMMLLEVRTYRTDAGVQVLARRQAYWVLVQRFNCEVHYFERQYYEAQFLSRNIAVPPWKSSSRESHRGSSVAGERDYFGLNDDQTGAQGKNLTNSNSVISQTHGGGYSDDAGFTIEQFLEDRTGPLDGLLGENSHNQFGAGSQLHGDMTMAEAAALRTAHHATTDPYELNDDICGGNYFTNSDPPITDQPRDQTELLEDVWDFSYPLQEAQENIDTHLTTVDLQDFSLDQPLSFGNVAQPDNNNQTGEHLSSESLVAPAMQPNFEDLLDDEIDTGEELLRIFEEFHKYIEDSGDSPVV